VTNFDFVSKVGRLRLIQGHLPNNTLQNKKIW